MSDTTSEHGNTEPVVEVLIQRATRWIAEQPIYNLRPHSIYGLHFWYRQVTFPTYRDGVVVLPFNGDNPVGLLSLKELRALSPSSGPVGVWAVLVENGGQGGGNPPRGGLLVRFSDPDRNTSNASLTVDSLNEVRMSHPEDESIPIFFVDFKGIR